MGASLFEKGSIMNNNALHPKNPFHFKSASMNLGFDYPRRYNIRVLFTTDTQPEK